MEEEKRVPNYNPKEDDKEYIGTKLLDGIERGASSWYKDERTLEGWEYLNPFSVATAGAIRGVEGVGWVLGNTPVAGDLLRGIGWAEDRLAEGARNVSGALTPDLDPRFAGWGTRLGTAILADKGIRKVAGATKATLKEGAERAAVRSGKKYTSTRPETMSDVWRDDLAGPRKTYERYSKKGYYPENPPPDPWLKEDLINRIDFVDPNLDDMMRMSEGLNPRRWKPTFEQGNLNIEPFQSNTYQRSVISKMNKFGMGDGVFRMNTYNAYLNKGNEGRDMLEAFLSPDRLKGSFQGYKKFNKKSVEYKWGAFLEKKGYDLAQGIQVHHINPLYDSIHLFDGVKFNSKEYWSLMDILIKNNARTGAIQKGDSINNLMMTLGQATDEATPHGIAHKFYNNFTPTFFSPTEMKKMNTVKGYRKKKARRWATLVNKSEEVILEAHKQWSLLNPEIASQLSFDELVDRLSNLDARGYNKLIDPKYQLPDMNSIIKEIAADKGLKGPIYRLNPPPVRDPSKITQLEQMTKEGDIINELRGMNKKPKPINPDQINIDDIFPDE